MIRVKVFDVNKNQEYFGWTSSMPRQGCSFSMKLQLDEGTFSTREVLEVFDYTSSSLKFIARCGSYKVEILDKDPQVIV